jgi:hypothetical protein
MQRGGERDPPFPQHKPLGGNGMLTVYACRRSSSSKLSRTQDDVDEIVDIMKDNVNKVLERDQMLTDMEDKAGV